MPVNMIFERKEDETDDQWDAFKAYRDMGLSRTVTGLAHQLGISRKTVQRYSKKHNWERRISAYDSWKVSETIRDKAEIIAHDALKDIESILADIILIAKSETAYKKREWATYWKTIAAGETPKTKPPASSTYSIGELIKTIAHVRTQLDSVSKSGDDGDAGIDKLMEFLEAHEPED